MNDSALVAIRTYVNHFEADVAKSALDAAGIESMIRSDDCGGTRPHLWLGGVALLVRPEDAGEAATLLDTVAQPAADDDTPRG
jgi:hypothetical protein